MIKKNVKRLMIKKTFIRVFDKGFRGVSVENHIIYFKIFNYKEKTNLPMNNTVDILLASFVQYKKISKSI